MAGWVKIETSKLKAAIDALASSTKTAMEDNMGDLARASSGAAPHDQGILDSSYRTSVSGTIVVTGEVAFSATHDGADYAIIMHEGSYNLGPSSRAKPGGTGMSGNHYPVGPKYLTRPLEGETPTYVKHIEEVVGGMIKRME